jgi:hypothetical protein
MTLKKRFLGGNPRYFYCFHLFFLHFKFLFKLGNFQNYKIYFQKGRNAKNLCPKKNLKKKELFQSPSCNETAHDMMKVWKLQKETPVATLTSSIQLTLHF